MEKILVTPRPFWDPDAQHNQILRQAGYEVVISPYQRAMSESEFIGIVADVKGVVLGLDPMSGRVIENAHQLRVISRYGVGLDNVDVAAATARGILVVNSPGINSIAVAEMTMALILSLIRHIPQHHARLQAGHWQRLPGMEMHGHTLGIIGFGRIGREVAKRAAAFGMRIIYSDPVPAPAAIEAATAATHCLFEELLSASDIVALHLPLTLETRNVIDERSLRLMKPTAYLVNTARGGLVDEQALYAALISRSLAGAACDVFASEPPMHSPLLSLDNFIGTPHAGSATRQTTARMAMAASNNLLAALHGAPTGYVVNPDVFDSY